jgi:Cu/Ag efflux protein CusF
LEVPTTGSVVQNSAGGASNLSDWIAGDQISFTANSTESGALQATNVKDKAISWFHSAKNGWITAIRPEQNQVDVMWNNTTYTLNTSSAKMVAGVKNPATLADFKIGDRVRARVVADTDGNPLTWNAQIMVVLRRGNDLFMRVTRWVVKGTITMIPEELGSPITIEVKIMPSDFFQANDVNNTLGAPGKIIKVDITPETKLFRRFLGKAYLKEFSEGDEINIIGRVDESSGHLVAKFIQNKSVQKLGKVYRLGKVDAVDLTANTINVSLIYTHLPERYWTIRVFPITKIIENDNTVTLADIQVGEKLRIIGGSADFTNKTVIAERIIVVKPILITPVAY